MSLTPPKWIEALRRRDQDDLVARLRALAHKWEVEGDGFGSHGGAARELLEVLDGSEEG